MKTIKCMTTWILLYFQLNSNVAVIFLDAVCYLLNKCQLTLSLFEILLMLVVCRKFDYENHCDGKNSL